MSRTSRNNMKDLSFFHIMVQGINQEYIFQIAKDKEKYLKLIYENSEGIDMIAFCIMDNHSHFLIQADNVENISKWMEKSNTSYAMYYNKKNDRVGYVFRDRYKWQPIKNEKHLCLCQEYIHNNPVKAHMCKDKGEYEFSSYTKIYGKNQKNVANKLAKITNQKTLDIQNMQLEQENFELIEDEKVDKQKLVVEIVNNFLQSKKIDMSELKNEKCYLKELVKILKGQNISYRIMEQYLNIGRERLRYLFIS